MVRFDCLLVELSAFDKLSDSYADAIDFIRLLRCDPRISDRFIERVDFIEFEAQVEYMEEHYNDYFVAYYKGIPVGYGGVVDNDIRFAVVPYYHNFGFGTQILKYIKKRSPLATGKIMQGNLASIKVFNKVGIPYRLI